MDLDGDGYISRKDLCEIMMDMDENFSANQIEDMLNGSIGDMQQIGLATFLQIMLKIECIVGNL